MLYIFTLKTTENKKKSESTYLGYLEGNCLNKAQQYCRKLLLYLNYMFISIRGLNGATAMLRSRKVSYTLNREINKVV